MKDFPQAFNLYALRYKKFSRSKSLVKSKFNLVTGISVFISNWKREIYNFKNNFMYIIVHIMHKISGQEVSNFGLHKCTSWIELAPAMASGRGASVRPVSIASCRTSRSREAATKGVVVPKQRIRAGDTFKIIVYFIEFIKICKSS